MANVDRPNGFRPVGTLSGSPWQGSVMKCFSDADNLFKGDVVVQAGDGVASGSGAYLNVDRADGANPLVDGGDIVGVVVGWEPNPSDLGALYHAASSTYGVLICTAPDVICAAQGDSSALAGAGIGLNYDIITTAGSTATGLSNMEIDSSSGVATAATPLKLIGVRDMPDMDITAANNEGLVIFNMHAFARGGETGTTGV